MSADPKAFIPSLLALLLAALPAVAGPPEVAATSPTAPTQGNDLFPYPWQQKTLANGLKVIVIPTPGEGLVSYRTVVRTGARDEYEKGVTGFAHFFEHMMFRGTTKYPADKYNEIITRMGADSNAYTSTDMTVYELDVAKEDLETVVEIESDRFMNLAYEKAAFETEAGAVYGEYRKNRSSPGFVLYEAMHREAFRKHTYAHTAMGFVEDIKAMPKKYDYSLGFFKRYYRPENCILVIAGDIDPEKTFALIEQYYSPWKPGYVAPKIAAEPAQKKATRKEIFYEGKTLPRVWVAYKGGAFAPEDKVWVASMVLAQLAFGETSDIYRELRLEQQRVESISAAAATDRDPELWSVVATIKNPDDVEAVLQRIEQTVAQYRDQLPDAAKVDSVKSHMRYEFLLGLDTANRVASDVAGFVGTAGDLARVEVLYDNLAAVTPEDVREAARRWLVDTQRTTMILRENPGGGKPTEPPKTKKGAP